MQIVGTLEITVPEELLHASAAAKPDGLPEPEPRGPPDRIHPPSCEIEKVLVGGGEAMQAEEGSAEEAGEREALPSPDCSSAGGTHGVHSSATSPVSRCTASHGGGAVGAGVESDQREG